MKNQDTRAAAPDQKRPEAIEPSSRPMPPAHGGVAAALRPSGTLTPDDLLNGLPTGVMVIDREGVILHANRQASNLLSLQCQNLAGRDVKKVMPAGGLDIMKAIQSKRQAAGLLLPELKNCFVHLTPLPDPGQGAVVTVFDYRLWQPYFGQSATLDPLSPVLTKIFEASSDGITIVNKHGYMILVNKSAADNVGVNKNELLGRHVSYLIKKNLADVILSLDVIRTRQPISKVVKLPRSGKEALSTATPILNPDGEVDMVVLNERDITAITSLEGSIRQQKKVLEKFKEEINALSLSELKKREMVAESPAMCAVLSTAIRLAHHGVSHILITGESGTGKSLLAKFIHTNSKRAGSPFVHINCAALPESLLEAELFGYEKGAFTGADPNGKAGLFEMAGDGTLFLDEIGEMPIALQAKLLTFLDSSEFRRIGGTQTMTAKCAVITATNQNLDHLTKYRQFRCDLYFRLRAFSLNIPPLRNRPEDIVHLAKAALDAYNKQYNQNRALDPLALEILQTYSYPGNVRELLNMIHQAVLLSDRKFIGTFLKATVGLAAAELVSAGVNVAGQSGKVQFQASPPKAPPLLESARSELEKSALLQALAKSRNTRDMAAYLGISQASVSRKLRKHGLTPPGVKNPTG